MIGKSLAAGFQYTKLKYKQHLQFKSSWSTVMNFSNLEDDLESCVCFITYKIKKSGLLE